MPSTKPRILCLALVVLVLGLLGCRPAPLCFQVTFRDAAGLGRGAKIVHRGLEIGRVTDVGLDDEGLVLVSVEIDAEYRAAVALNSVIRIDATGLRRRRQLTIEDGQGERLPVGDRGVLTGSEGAIEDFLTKLDSAARAAWDRATETAADLEARLRELRDSEEAEELAKAMREFAERTAERTREDWQRFRTEELPKLRVRAEEVKRQLAERGMAEEAEELWRDFARWVEEVTERQSSEGSDTGNNETEENHGD